MSTPLVMKGAPVRISSDPGGRAYFNCSFLSGLDIECMLASRLLPHQHHAIPPLHQPISIGTNTPIPLCRLISINPQPRLLQRPLDDPKIHHRVTPTTDHHSIIHLGVPKFPGLNLVYVTRRTNVNRNDTS